MWVEANLAAQTLLLFESDLRIPSASGGHGDVCRQPRHYSNNNYLFADGHLAALTAAPRFEVNVPSWEALKSGR